MNLNHWYILIRLLRPTYQIRLRLPYPNTSPNMEAWSHYVRYLHLSHCQETWAAIRVHSLVEKKNKQKIIKLNNCEKNKKKRDKHHKKWIIFGLSQNIDPKIWSSYRQFPSEKIFTQTYHVPGSFWHAARLWEVQNNYEYWQCFPCLNDHFEYIKVCFFCNL